MNTIVTQLQKVAAQSPEEICGVITTDGEICPITNVSKHKTTCFVFSRAEYFALIKRLKSSGKDIAYIYHSHPSGTSAPSKADKEFGIRSGRKQLIVTATDYTVF